MLFRSNGEIYGITAFAGYVEVLNPMKHESYEFAYRVDETKGVTVLENPDPEHAGVPHNPMLDSKGNLWETGPGGTWIISPEGKTLGVIRAPERSTAIGFGDNDMKTLYIAARSSIYKIRTNVVGLR